MIYTKGFVAISFLDLVTPVISSANVSPDTFRGFYFGNNIGGAWGTSNYHTNPGCPPNGANAVFCGANETSVVNGSAVGNSGSGKLSPSSITGGIQVGHNWQKDRIVFGGEADFGALDFDKSYNANGIFPFEFLGNQYNLNGSASTDWLVTVRGRIGATVMPQVLLYATGGAAFTRYKVSSSYSDNAIGFGFPGGSGSAENSYDRTGWAVGGGAEWLLAGFWSMKAEYLYLDFGSVNLSVPVSNTIDFTQTMIVKFGLQANLIRFGLNYRV